MKKGLFKILVLGLATVLAFSAFSGCGSSKWKGSQMTDWGNVSAESLGGFIAETDNYLYYINGVGTSSDDNKLGVPTKGALYAVDKSDFTKNKVAVPKLFASSDYDTGIFISGDYVYYGTPSTEKNSHGDIAYTDLAITRSKLDGTDTKVLFTAGSLALKHRFVEVDGKVFVIYYDTDNSAIVSYDVDSASAKEIAKTDEKTDKMETLGSYTFVPEIGADGVAVAYTSTVYREAYNQDKNEATGSSRGTENYNKVYALVAGDSEAKLVYDGKTEEATYAIKLIKDGFVFYTKTVNGTSKTYAVSMADFAGGKAGVEVFDEYAVSTTLIQSLNEVYVIADNNIYKDTMIKKDMGPTTKKLVAKCSSISSFLFKDGDSVYYYNSSNNIVRIALGDVENTDAKEIRISDDTVTTTWYAPELVKVNGNDYLFYVDNSTTGLSYVKYVALDDSKIVAEDTDDDGEDDLWYLSGSKFLSNLTIDDNAKIMTAKINALSTGEIEFEEVNGELKAVKLQDTIAEYDALSAEVKEKVEDTAKTKIANIKEAIRVANLLKKVDGAYDSSTDQTALESAYNEIKAEINALFESEDYTKIASYIDGNMFANYQKCQKLFDSNN